MSLPAEDLEFLDAYAQAEGYSSRSAVLHKAVRLLQAAELSSAYEEAWEEWSASGDATAWEVTVGDGVNP